MPSEYVRQELRAIVGARTQGQQQQQQQQQQPQQALQQPGGAGGVRGGAGTSGGSSLSHADLEALGLQLELGGAPSEPASPLFPLLPPSDTPASQPTSRVDDKPSSDQRKSLLQQLLSEPT